MIIKNTTDKKTPKIIGVGPYWIMPGDEKYIPDDILYVQGRDKFNRPSGKKVLLPSVVVQEKLGMLKVIGSEDSPSIPANDTMKKEEDANATTEKPEMTEDEKKKAEAAAKRKAAREAKKAAKAAKAAEESAEPKDGE